MKNFTSPCRSRNVSRPRPDFRSSRRIPRPPRTPWILAGILSLVLLAPAGAQDCVDTDHGTHPFTSGMAIDDTNGILRDSCSDSETLQEAVCLADGSITTVAVTCEFGCHGDAGACFTAGDVCTDSDQGLVPTVRGLVSDKTGLERWDRCKDANTLQERTCGADGLLDNNDVFCPAGCDSDNDVCNVPAAACTDSDSGLDPSSGGVVQVGTDSFPDACANDWTLVEQVCGQDGSAQQVQVRCDLGCDSAQNACHGTEPARELDEMEFWDNGLDEICFYHPDFPELSHTEGCQSVDGNGVPTSRYWTVAFASGSADAPGCEDVTQLVLGDPQDGVPGPHVFVEPECNCSSELQGVRLIQDYSTERHPCGNLTHDWLTLQLAIRQGHPEFPHPHDLITRVRLRPDLEIDPAADGDGTRFNVILTGQKAENGLADPVNFLLGLTLFRDKSGNAGFFDSPCVVTARPCFGTDACSEGGGGEILHLYGSCFDMWIEPGEERELRIDWHEILDFATQLQRDGNPLFTPYDEDLISIKNVRVSFEVLPGEVKARRSELLVQDLTLLEKQRN